jgi:hypothetical protein
VATFNIKQLQGAGLTQIIDIVRTVDADVWGLQETDQGQGPIIADALGYHHAEGNGGPGRSFVSRFPILEVTDGRWGAKIRVSADNVVWLFNMHLGLHPNWERSYIPYAASHDLTEQQIIDNVLGLDNWVTRMEDLGVVLEPVLTTGAPVFMTGDFNEPPHVDWTAAQADAGIIPIAVDSPLSHVMTDGLVLDYHADLVDHHGDVTHENVHIKTDFAGWNLGDAYHVDRLQDGDNEVTRRGFTWTPGGSGRDDDRIDFVYFGGDEVSVLDAQVFGEAGGLGVDIGFAPFPSDHRGVVIDFELPFPVNQPCVGDLDADGDVDQTDLGILLAEFECGV